MGKCVTTSYFGKGIGLPNLEGHVMPSLSACHTIPRRLASHSKSIHIIFHVFSS